tara:strand:- start:302 stop:721 length:420 start_codon:yes stop_codon:yes gene_type:complete
MAMEFASIITDMQSELEELKERIDDLEDEKEDLINKNEKLEERIDELENDQMKLEDELINKTSFKDINALYPENWLKESEKEEWVHAMSYDDFTKEEKNTEYTIENGTFGFLWGLKLFEKKICIMEKMIKELKIFPYPE